MRSREPEAVWNKKGCTLSDKSARKEFGLTQEEIIKAINRRELQYRLQSIHGNPFLRLIRSEVEEYVKRRSGTAHLKQKKLQKELADIDRDLKSLEKQMAHLRKRRAELMAGLEGGKSQRSRGTATSRHARK